MHVIATYPGVSQVKLNDHALSIMVTQEDTFEERFMYMRSNYPDIELGDWIGIDGEFGNTIYGLVKKIIVDERPGWEESAKEYNIHLPETNQDVTCWPIDFVSHAPMYLVKKVHRAISDTKICKDMYELTTRIIRTKTECDINWL